MRAVFAIVFVALLGAHEAVAASCADLRAQLAAAQNGGSNARAAAQYDAYGCNSTSPWGRHRSCGTLERQMRGGGANARTIRALQSQVSTACATETREASRRTRTIGGRIVVDDSRVPEERRGGGFFGNLFGRRDREVLEARVAPRAATEAVERLDMEEARGQRRRDEDGPSGADATLPAGSSGKTLREGSTQTVCVRLCDGFYFPINGRSHPANFYEELAMCVGRCPGADVSLYAHGSGTAVEGMRSAFTDERYSDLPTAFDYRKSLSSDCGCQTRTVVAGALSADRTLGYVGLARDTATPATAVASLATAGWVPLRSVLDETGKPLPPSLTDRSVVDGEVRPAQSTPPPAPLPLTARRSAPPQLPLSGPAPSRLREVGPQFFSEAFDAEARSKQRRAAVVTTTAVRVVPLSEDALEDGADPAPASTAERAEAGAGTAQDLGAL